MNPFVFMLRNRFYFEDWHRDHRAERASKREKSMKYRDCVTGVGVMKEKTVSVPAYVNVCVRAHTGGWVYRLAKSKINESP